MIRTVADFLVELLVKEQQKLAEFDIDHAPTIGSMYEGLTASILRRAIPVELGLRVVDGFVFDGVGGRSGQIDCMVVCGAGTQIPHTSSWQWHVRNVIAVIEVKKTLLGADLADAFMHLREVKERARCYLQSQPTPDEPVDIRAGLKAFAQITHTVAPDYEHLDDLTFENKILFHTIIAEQFGPIKIVFGYDGFKTELGFRNSLVRFLTANLDQRGYGPGSFPELIVSGSYSLAKANGLPYSAPMRDQYWDFYFSSPTNPLLLLLEFIWTQLDRKFKIEGFWGDDLDVDVTHPFLAARPVRHGSQIGWDLEYREFGAKVLAADTNSRHWEPEYLSPEEAVVIMQLCQGTAVRLDDADLLGYLKEQGISLDDLRGRLLSTNLIALKGNSLELITDACVCLVLPDGAFVAAENSTGRLTSWLATKKVALRATTEDPQQSKGPLVAAPSRAPIEHIRDSATALVLREGMDAVALPLIRKVTPQAVVVIDVRELIVTPVGPTHVIDVVLSTLLIDGFVVSTADDEHIPRLPAWRATLSDGVLEVISPGGIPLYSGPIDVVPLWAEAIGRTHELVVVAGSLLGSLDPDAVGSIDAALASGRAVAGIVPVSYPVRVVPRNAECPCGSGKKYKRCHGERY